MALAVNIYLEKNLNQFYQKKYMSEILKSVFWHPEKNGQKITVYILKNYLNTILIMLLKYLVQIVIIKLLKLLEGNPNIETGYGKLFF